MYLLDTLIVAIGVFVGNILSYILQIFLGRFLSQIEYGEFIVLLSLFSIFTVPIVIFNTSLIKLISDVLSSGNRSVLSALFYKFSKILLMFGISIALLVFISRSTLVEYLHLSNLTVVNYFVFFISVSFVTTLPANFLQGFSRFRTFSLMNVVSLLLRLVVPCVFVLYGYRVDGVFFGMALAAIASYLIGFLLLKKDIAAYSHEVLSPYYKKLVSFGVGVMYVNVCLAILTNIDVILVKHYFSPELAGVYSAVVTVGKIILFGTSAVVVVMLPKVASAYSKGESTLGLFKRFLVLQLALVVPAAIVFVLFPDLIVALLFPKFQLAIPYIPVFAVFMSLYVLANFLLTFLLSVNRQDLWKPLFPAVCMQMLLIINFHSTLMQVIIGNISATIFLLLLLIFYFIKANIYTTLPSNK